MTTNTFLELLFSEPGIIAELSLTELCAKLFKRNLAISKQGLDKRFNENAVNFLKQIYLHLYEAQAKQPLHKLHIASTLKFRNIRILDGTSIKLPAAFRSTYPGTVGAGTKCQLEFDYLTGQFLYVEIQAGKAGDSATGMHRLETVQKDDLILQDLGYFKCDLFREVEKREAFYVSRARVDTMFYVDSPNPRYHQNGEIMKKYAHERLYLEEEIKTMKRGEMKEYPKVYIGKHERLPSRLVIYRMTRKEEGSQKHRIKRREQTKPSKIKQKSRNLSGISIYVTNLPMNVPMKEITSLYRYRWQIELVFRSWKSDMKVAHYREMKLERWECHLYVELIMLLISMLVTYQLRLYFWEEKNILLSEQISMREVTKEIWSMWQSRDSPKWSNIIKGLIKLLARIGRKNIKSPGPIDWLANVK